MEPHAAVITSVVPGACMRQVHERSAMATDRYEFRVAGRLSERAQHAFEGMQVVEAQPETIIRGEIRDESHLYGVLALLQTLSLRVVAVNKVPD
jgi:hypothetical protein